MSKLTEDADKKMGSEILKYRLERQNASQSYNSEMSKWILGSLIAVNGAPFLLLSKDLPELAKIVAQDAWYFTLAIALAILCGFCAWLNTGMREAVSGYQVERLISELSPIESVSHNSVGERTSALLVRLAYTGALITGFGSLAMFLWGGWALSSHYIGEKPALAPISVAAPPAVSGKRADS